VHSYFFRLRGLPPFFPFSRLAFAFLSLVIEPSATAAGFFMANKLKLPVLAYNIHWLSESIARDYKEVADVARAAAHEVEAHAVGIRLKVVHIFCTPHFAN
jgi:hypothetical protein